MAEYSEALTMEDTSSIAQEAKYLMILSCSKRKRPVYERSPAIQVYDGPMYRALRKRLGRLDLSLVDICIVSAKYGLITAMSTIEHYDWQMTAERAVELRDVVLPEIVQMIQNRSYREILVNLGPVYGVAIYGLEESVPTGTQLTFTSGRIGQRVSQTISWLERVARVGLNGERTR